MKMKKKKNNSNPPYEEKLATTCAPKIQKKKSIEKSKGKCIMELMDVAEATCHFNCPFQDDIIMEILYSGRHGSKVPGEIFSLKSGSWRTIDNHPRGIENLLHCSGSALALVNDAFHWVCISGNYFDDSRAFSLVSFSISKEVYADIPLPGQLLRLGGNIGIGVSELDGMLCAYSICEHQRKRTFKLWVLKDYGVGECNYLHLDCVIGIGISELDGMLCAHSICEHQRKRTFKLWVLKDYGVGESWIALFVIDASDILRAVPKYRYKSDDLWILILVVPSLLASSEIRVFALPITEDGIGAIPIPNSSRDKMDRGQAPSPALEPITREWISGWGRRRGRDGGRDREGARGAAPEAEFVACDDGVQVLADDAGSSQAPPGVQPVPRYDGMPLPVVVATGGGMMLMSDMEQQRFEKFRKMDPPKF
ncbi:hypothetical protein T459_26087 [Capsicum annuum]|uniref:F-box associated domain-containing protein n=1 Tax=Capsicum annuum TaxID=4072 RepID=A0A2G2YMJ5_CAPAN|nr:hypothetical protein T459_26087 [Capsicum annuum]